MFTFKFIVQVFFAISVFINAALFIPQAKKIIKQKSAEGLSLFMFLGFNIIQVALIFHSYFLGNYLAVFGFCLGFLSCAMVTALIIKYGNEAPCQK